MSDEKICPNCRSEFATDAGGIDRYACGSAFVAVSPLPGLTGDVCLVRSKTCVIQELDNAYRTIAELRETISELHKVS